MIAASALTLCAALMAAPKGNLEATLHALHWNGQSSIRLDVQGKIVAIDPYQIHHSYVADVVLITHPHSDHFSPADLAKVVGIRTVIAAPPECLTELRKHFPRNTFVAVHPGFRQTLAGIPVEAVPAYNIIKKDKHPKSKGWVGYILTVDGVRLYHSGDTERIPELISHPKNTGFETRLNRLRAALTAAASGLAIEPRGRGQFALVTDCRLELVEPEHR